MNIGKASACLLLAISAGPAAFAAQMLTPWGEKVTSGNCWRGYPRPQMVRAGWTNLNGDWDYAVTSVTNTPGRPERWDGKIRVPFPVESALSGVGRLLEPHEFLWYTRKIVCDPRPGERTLLHFGGVDFRAMVFIGHDEVTDVPHEGGQNPFTLDITDYVKKGENTLTVCVWDPTEDFVNSRGKQSFRPKGCFYTRVSGIWQTVWMETVPEKHIRSCKVFTDIDRGTVRFEFDKVEGAGEVEVTTDMPKDFECWSPENPRLYSFTAKYGRDVVKGQFGMRKFERRKDAKGVLRFFLNNRPYFPIGTLDQGWWPDGLLTPPSEEAMEYDVKVLKDCGFNMLRKHIKVEPQQYYAMCDRLGILVIQDLPSGTGSWADPMKAETVGRYWLERQEMKEMMDGLQPFACVVMWNPYNEGWSQPGEFLTHSMLDFVRRYDKTRLVNGPSGCWDWEGGHLLPEGWGKNRVLTQHRPDGVCEAADTVDMHLYRGPTMFETNGRRISFLGEFGGLGHPVAGHLWKEPKDGKGNWGYGGIEDTKTREGLEKAYLGLMERLGELAENGLGGSVYTQTTDVEIEINGLLTYDRKVLKYNPEVLRKAHEMVKRRAALADPAPGVKIALELKPGPDNPRNSEGAFMPLKDGRIMFAYSRYYGKSSSDHATADIAARYSSDKGATWTDRDEVIVKNHGGMNVMSVSLLRLQSGEIALFYLLKNSTSDCRPVMRRSFDEGKTWSEPTMCIADEVGYFVLNNDRVIQLKDGRLLFAVSLHSFPDGKFDNEGAVMTYFSDDNGKTWRRGKSVLRVVAPDGKRRAAQEPGVVECRDGGVLLWIRTNAGCQYMCRSTDRGETFSAPQPSPLVAPLSPASIKRLPTGDLLALWNDHGSRPDMKSYRQAEHSWASGRRSPLAAALSGDDGKTWKDSKFVESDPDGWFCYIAVQPLDDGTVLLGYCAYNNLSHSRIVKVPVSWFYQVQ